VLLALQSAARVQRLERQQVDVRCGLAAALGDARVVAQHAVLGPEGREQRLQVVRLELEVGAVRGRGERDVDLAGFLRGAEAGEQVCDARQGLGGGEVLALQGGVFGVVLFGGAGQLGPVVEDFGGAGTGAALQLGFDGPGEGGAVVFGEQDVGAEGVEVFGVEDQAVHVEETGTDRGWRGHCVCRETRQKLRYTKSPELMFVHMQ
jgi:hypothetical protein